MVERSVSRAALPQVVAAEYLGGYRIRVSFDDGVRGDVDFRRWLTGPVFEPLRNPEFFRRFTVQGGTVSWPNGADLAPETLHVIAKARSTS